MKDKSSENIKRDRVRNAVLHRKTDRIPHNAEMTSGLIQGVCDYIGIEPSAFDEWADNHIEKYTCSTADRQIAPGYFEDEFGVVWNRKVDKDIGVIEKPLLIEPDCEDFELPPVDEQFFRNGLSAFAANGKDTFKFAKINFSLFERAWSLRGFENLLTDLLLEPDFVQELLRKITDRNLKIIDIALEYDIDGLYFGDDYGQQTGMLMSPDSWRTFIKPHLQTMFSRIKSAGKYSSLHSCGNITPILGDLADIGLDIYQTVQPEIYNLEQLKGNFGKDLCFFGAISTQRDLPHKSPQEIAQIVRRTIDILGKSGGYIAAPTHKIPQDTPPQNVVAMIETFKNQ